MPKGIYEHKSINTYVTLSDREHGRFKIALRMNKLTLYAYSARLNYNYGSFRTIISNKNRHKIADKFRNPIIEYTNNVYKLIEEGINPRGMEVLKHRPIDSHKYMKLMGQKEIEQIIAKTIPSLYEYIKSSDVIYMAVQSIKKSKMKEIRDYFVRQEYSVIKKVAYLENMNGKRKSMVILVAKAVDKDKLVDEYGSCLEDVMARIGG